MVDMDPIAFHLITTKIKIYFKLAVVISSGFPYVRDVLDVTVDLALLDGGGDGGTDEA